MCDNEQTLRAQCEHCAHRIALEDKVTVDNFLLTLRPFESDESGMTEQAPFEERLQ